MATTGTEKYPDKTSQSTSFSEYPRLLWKGAAMGVAEVVPGVSGGTIALITGILKRFIEAIHSFDSTAVHLILRFRFREFFRHFQWRFLVMLFSGQVLGVLLFTKIIPLPSLLHSHPEPMRGLFFGLIVASIVMLARDSGLPGFKGILAYLVGGVIGGWVVAGIRADTPNEPWFMLICGAIIICAWILPGISGSFILLLLHKYNYVWEAVTMSNEMSFIHNVSFVILPFGIGAVIGLISFTRFLSWVMDRFPKHTTMAMTGLLTASLWAIFPFQDAVYEAMASGKEKLVSTRPFIPSAEYLARTESIVAFILMVLGFSLVLWIDHLARKKSRVEPFPAAVSSDNLS